MEKSRSLSAYDILKRGIDIIGAIIALILSAPILAVSTLLIRLDGGKAFFVQPRVGLDGETFGMFKLRTMIPDAFKLESIIAREQHTNGGYGVAGEYNDPRITKVGAILRKFNLDELPQFINVLKGDMSFVGPRPLPLPEKPLYGGKLHKAFSSKPGITGYWQVNRRLSTMYDERVEMDCHYAKKRSLLLDVLIFLQTPISMLTSDYNSVSKPIPLTEGMLVREPVLAGSRTGQDESLAEH